MRVGRQKQPIDLILAKENKAHKTKKEIQERKAGEVKVDSDKIEPPSRLTKKQKDRFNFLADQLIQAKIFTNLDVESLAEYVVLEQQYNKLAKAINSSKIDILSDKYDNLLAKQAKVFRMLEKLSDKLCLNILSRAKVSVPKEKQEKKVNKFAQFGSGANG